MKVSKLLEHIDSQTTGVLWFTKKAIASDHHYFSDFDYLCDGILSTRLGAKLEETPQSPHLFVTNNFGQNLYISHFFNESEKFSWEEIQSTLQLIFHSSQGQDSKLILVSELDNIPKEMTQKIKKKFDQVELISL